MTFIMQRPSIPLFIVPVAVPAAYLIYLSWKITSQTTVTTGRQRADGASPPPPRPVSLPAEVCADDGSQWIVSYERVVSKPVSTSEITVSSSGTAGSQEEKQRQQQQPSALLQAYSRATHLAFRSTPQARIMRLAIGDPDTKRTFDANWIQGLLFKQGDVVNGAYKVAYHGPGPAPASERVELAIEAPASYRGPPAPKGLILAEVQHVEDGSAVLFVNETWMWRRHDERPTLIEGGFGALLHGLMAGWMVLRGIESVTA